MKNIRKKSVAVLAGLALAGIVGASAASLGGVRSESLGADVGVVGSCDTDGVDVDFDTAVAGNVVTVSGLNMSDINAACNGQDVQVTLLDSANAQVGNVVTGAADGSGSLSLTGFGAPDAEAVTGIAVVISG
ncbi:MAG TPA: hypothetical protein VGK49_12620 [Ilumatobacteraceae bacterium]